MFKPEAELTVVDAVHKAGRLITTAGHGCSNQI